MSWNDDMERKLRWIRRFQLALMLFAVMIVGTGLYCGYTALGNPDGKLHMR